MSLALDFHELATNAANMARFLAKGLLQVSWTVTDAASSSSGTRPRSPVGPSGARFPDQASKSALWPFDGKTEISLPEDRRSLHHAMPVPAS